MANCKACTAPLPEGATICPACDEPVYPRTAPVEPAAGAAEGRISAPSSELKRPEATPTNEAFVALTAGVVSIAFGFMPCLCGLFGIPGTLVSVAAGAVAISKGTAELARVDRGESPEASRTPANAGRITGFAGIAVAAVMLVLRLALVAFMAWRLHRR